MELYEWRAEMQKSHQKKLSIGEVSFAEYLDEFPRDVSVWLEFFASLEGREAESSFILATERCHKYPEIWLSYLKWLVGNAPEKIVHAALAALEAIGSDWDCGFVVEYALKNTPEAEKDVVYSYAARNCVNRQYPVMHTWIPQTAEYHDHIADNRGLYELKKKFEPTLAYSNYLGYVDELLSFSVKEARAVHERMVSKYNDHVQVWMNYYHFLRLHAGEDEAYERAIQDCFQIYSRWNYMLLFQYAKDVILREGVQLVPQMVIDRLIETCWLDLEVIELILSIQPTDRVRILKRLIERFEQDQRIPEGIVWLRVELYKSLPRLVTNRISVLESAIDSVVFKSSSILSSVDLVPFCYAFLALSEARVRIPHREKVDKVLKDNHASIIQLIVPPRLSVLVPTDDMGRPPPPRAVNKAPPPPSGGFNRQQGQARPSMPGYTPGYLAEQNAKKFRL
jgi:hypothetical protein